MTANAQHSFSTLPYAALLKAATASDTTLYLIPGSGSEFQEQWAAGRNLYLTLTNPSGDIEVVKVTEIYADILTVERGQDGTTAQAWGVGAIVCQRGPATDYTSFLQKGAFLTGSVNPNGVYSVSYPGQKYYQDGATSCEKRWFIGISGTTWQVLAGDQVCFSAFVHQQRAPTTRLMRYRLNGIAENGTVIIASGEDGDIRSTDTGSTFIAENDGTSQPEDTWVAYGGGVWVKAGSTLAGKRSVDDGLTWTSFSWANAYSGTVYRVKYLGGKFIMLGDNQTIQTSTDGITWTETHKVTSNIRFNDIDFDGTTYVICAWDWLSNVLHIYSTTDLVTLTDIPTGLLSTAYNAKTIAYGNGTWVCCVSYSTTHKAIYSADLITWNEVTLTYTGSTIQTLIYGNLLFVLLMAGNSSGGGYVRTSPDGVTWTDRTITRLSGHDGVNLYSAIWTGTGFIAVGEGWTAGASAGQTMVTSLDGVTWAESAAPFARYDSSYNVAVVTRVGFMAAGSFRRIPGVLQYGTFIEESDGVDPSAWSAYDITQSNDGLNAHAAIDTTVKYLCAVHSNFLANTTNDIFESTDGLTWTSTGKGTFGIGDMAVDPSADGGAGLLMAVVSGTGLWKNDGSLSGAGTTQNIPGFYPYCVAFGGGTWVLGGNSGAIYTSSDGTNWTQRAAAGSYTGTFQAVAYGNGQFVIVGTSGEIQYSTDAGVTWHHAAADGGYTGDFEAVSYGEVNGKSFYVVCGHAGEIQSSDDGHIWTHRAADKSFADRFTATAFISPYFVVFGDHGEIQAATVS